MIRSVVSGDERDSHDDFYEDALNCNKYIDSGTTTKFGNIHITQAESTENESVSSLSSHEDEDYLQIIRRGSNMDFLDEPDSDYSDGSEHELAEWSDAVIEDDDDDSVDLERGSTNSDLNDEEMSDPDIMDVFTDYSEQDGDDEEEEEDAGPQAIEVDNENSDNSVEIMSSGGEEEEEPVVEFDPDSDTDEPNAIDDRIVVHYNNDNFFDTSSDFEENSQISQFSTPSGSSRSRSPIAELSQSNSRPAANSVPPVLAFPSLEPSAPPANDTESTQPVDKPSSSKSSTKSPTNGTADVEGDGLCCICLDSVSTHVVVPCGHICLCQHCKEVYESNDNHRRKKKCPLCKTPFTIIIKVYK